VLHAVFVGGLLSLDAVEVGLADLALLDCGRGPVQVTTWGNVVVDAGGHSHEARRRDDVGHKEVANEEVRGVVWDLSAESGIVGAEAQVGEEVRPGMVGEFEDPLGMVFSLDDLHIEVLLEVLLAV